MTELPTLEEAVQYRLAWLCDRADSKTHAAMAKDFLQVKDAAGLLALCSEHPGGIDAGANSAALLAGLALSIAAAINEAKEDATNAKR